MDAVRGAFDTKGKSPQGGGGKGREKEEEEEEEEEEEPLTVTQMLHFCDLISKEMACVEDFDGIFKGNFLLLSFSSLYPNFSFAHTHTHTPQMNSTLWLLPRKDFQHFLWRT